MNRKERRWKAKLKAINARSAEVAKDRAARVSGPRAVTPRFGTKANRQKAE